MIEKFLKNDDVRLDQVANFEIQTINKDGITEDLDWHDNTTFTDLFFELKKKHKKGIEISVLDYGDELQATVTPYAKSANVHYTVLMVDC